MRLVIKIVAFAFLFTSLNLSTIPSASAGCQDYPESITPQCVAENLAIAKLAQEAYEASQIAKRLQEEQTAWDNAAKDNANRAATVAADNTLAPDDCARSENRYLQRCIDASVEKAKTENEAIDAARKVDELKNLQEIAGNKLAANDCASSTNKFLQVCIDAAIAQVASDNAAISAARKLEYTQSLLTKPVLNSNGEVIRTALLKSKSLNAKDIKTVLDTANLTTSDKELLTLYAQKINSIKGSQSTKTIKIPLSKTPSEEFNSATPTVCAVVSGLVKTLKPGVCILNIKFATESGFEVQTTKKITLKK